MNNDVKFEHMEPVVEAICKSLEENPADWKIRYGTSSIMYKHKHGHFNNWVFLDQGINRLLVGSGVDFNPIFNKRQSVRIIASYYKGRDKIRFVKINAMQQKLINSIKPQCNDDNTNIDSKSEICDRIDTIENGDKWIIPSIIIGVLVALGIMGLGG